MSWLEITYKCCKAIYRTDLRLVGGAANAVPTLDRLHAQDHPECPPLDEPLPVTPHDAVLAVLAGPKEDKQR